MADVSTYRRCITAFSTGTVTCGVNEVRAAGDPLVSANPQFWSALTDAQMASAGWLLHPK